MNYILNNHLRNTLIDLLLNAKHPEVPYRFVSNIIAQLNKLEKVESKEENDNA